MITDKIAKLPLNNKIILGLFLGLIIWAGFRYLIYLANNSWKKEVSERKHKPTQLDRLKALAE